MSEDAAEPKSSSAGGLAPPGGITPAQRRQPFQILCLSGGGYRGLYTARILAEFEAQIGAPIASRFDLIAGTSIGGILAMALSLEIPARKMAELFEQKGEEIFKKRWSILGLNRSSYSQDSLQALLASEDLFGQQPLGACRHRVIVPSVNHTQGRPVLFKTPHHQDFVTDHRHRLVDIALATSAAPGFFPRHMFNGSQYVDGGLYANAPGQLALHEAEHFLRQRREDLHLLSIGTMSAKVTVAPRRNRNGGTIDWGGWDPRNMPKRLFGVAISAQEAIVHNLLGHALPSDHYQRIDADLNDIHAEVVALDKTGPKAREILISSAAESAKAALGNRSIQLMLARVAAEPEFFHGPHASSMRTQTC